MLRNNNKLILIFLAFLMVFSGFVHGAKKVSAEEIATEIESKSKSSYMIDADSKSEIVKNNELERLPIASMCKIMTLLLVFEKIDEGELSLNEEIVISDNASSMGGSQIFLESGGEYQVEQLIKGIIVASANDACVALAERLYGSEESFVSKMNEKCLQLKMENTVFTNCTGLPKEGQYSCAKDVATMFAELIKHEKYFDYSSIWMDEINHPKDRKTEISNTNKLVRFYPGCIGGKTGYTSEAGHCLCAVAKRDNLRLISVVISAPNSKARFNEVSNMFNFGFANYCSKKIVDAQKEIKVNIAIKNGKNDVNCVVPERSVNVFSKKNEKNSYEIVVENFEDLRAPIKSGQVVGELHVFENGIEVACVNLLSKQNVDKKTYYDNLKDCIDNWNLVG